jgi:hypothetical protein
MLFDLEWYSRFDGKNGFDIPFPSKPRENGSRGNSGGGNRGPAGFKPTNLEAFLSLDFMERNSYFKLNDSISTVATTTLREICAKHRAQKTVEEFLQEQLEKNNATKLEIKANNFDFVDPKKYVEELKKYKEIKKGKSLNELFATIIK